MKTLYIYTTIDATKSVLSFGFYWDCSGKNPIETAWEYIGTGPELLAALAKLRDESDAEFVHVINRSI